MKRCIIIAGGNCNISALKSFLSSEDYIIAADSGYSHCLKASIKPDLLIGDFDSFEGELPTDIKTITLPCQKDDTDLMFAARCGVDKGFTDFVIFGGYGSRPDQNYAMYQTLFWLKKHPNVKNCTAYCDGFEATALINELKEFHLNKNRYLSVFAFDGACEGVTIKGTDYDVTDAFFTPEFPVGVSNQADGVCSVSVKKGSLLIITVDKNI